MKKLSTILLVFFLGYSQVHAQANREEIAVKATINLLFDGMKNGDTVMIRKAFSTQNTMQTIAKNKDGKFVVKTENVNDLLKVWVLLIQKNMMNASYLQKY